jgi:predicted transcriptional regulator
MKLKKDKTRIQLVIASEINQLLDSIAEKERRTRSAVVELALQAYARR